MRPEIRSNRDKIAEICAAHGVGRLEVFGSAARDVGFNSTQSDADFLVTFLPGRGGLLEFAEFKDALTRLLDRPVDLVERIEIEQTRNYIRRERILAEAEPVYG